MPDFETFNEQQTFPEIFEPAAPVYDSVAGDEFNAEYLNNVLSNAPQMPDDSLPRYAMSFLLPIALMNMAHADKYGDFNFKDPRTGFNKTNLNWYPAFELMPLYGVEVDVPFENFPTEPRSCHQPRRLIWECIRGSGT